MLGDREQSWLVRELNLFGEQMAFIIKLVNEK